MSSLESKGLEFDDVVVGFRMKRQLWLEDCCKESALRMLRELYVALTRAQHRVVILVMEGDAAMKAVFTNLGCDEVDAETIVKQFNSVSMKEQWLDRGYALFEGLQFKLASSCFNRAQRHDWSAYSNGKELLMAGMTNEGIKEQYGYFMRHCL